MANCLPLLNNSKKKCNINWADEIHHTTKGFSQGWQTELQLAVALLSASIELEQILFGFKLLTTISIFNRLCYAGSIQQQSLPCGKLQIITANTIKNLNSVMNAYTG